MTAILDPVFGCLLAQGRTDRDGYAFHGRTRAHIHAWEQHHGARLPDHEVDHMCRRRNCIALHHLELVTRSENEKRKSWRYLLRRKTCPRGHDMSIHKVMTPEHGVVCRLCNREAMR